MHMVVFGLGYTGIAIAHGAQSAGMRVQVTSRRDTASPGLDVIPFADAAAALAQATHVVSTVPPGSDGGDEHDGDDPVLHAHGPALAAAPLRWVGYLSTTGVYGDRGGGWVDEDTPPAPGQARSQRRLRAEAAWRELGTGRAVDIFRVAGIYGPGRSALDDVRAGRARRIHKPGHLFGRIHRDDIAGAVLAAACQDRGPGVRILNLNDDEPAAPSDVIAHAASLLGVAPPPLVPFAEAVLRMGEMGRSFWAENRRVSGARTRVMLGRDWLYPSYREGLAAILAQEIGEEVAQQVADDAAQARAVGLP